MVKKVPAAIATAMLVAFLSGNAVAATEQEAYAQLDRIPAVAADAQKAAHDVLSELVVAGVPVDQALEVVRSAVEHDYSAGDLSQVGAEIREQVQAGIPAGQVVAVADQAIDAGKSAAGTQDALNTFQQGAEQGKRDGEARAQGSVEGTVSGEIERSAANSGGMGTGMGISSMGAGMGTGMGTGSMGAGANFSR